MVDEEVAGPSAYDTGESNELLVILLIVGYFDRPMVLWCHRSVFSALYEYFSSVSLNHLRYIN